MKEYEYIINSFIFKETNTLNDIYEYCKKKYNISDNNKIKLELNYLIKNKIIFFNINYQLTDEGIVILNDNKYYYARIIFKFFKKYSKNYKKYQLKEIRLEQQALRTYLINNKKHSCIICNKKLPLCLLETAHLKPRCILNYNEKIDINIVEFMCRFCHNLYDNGLIGVNNGLLCISTLIKNYDLYYIENTQIINYNILNAKYFNFHYNYIYK